METKAIATKFAHHDVPKLETLKSSMVYQLREKLNNGGKLTRAEKNWLTKELNLNASCKRAILLGGYRFDFKDVLKIYVVKQYGGWTEYNAPDRMSLRILLQGKVHKIQEVI